MAEDTPTGPVEMGAEMDYAEHDKTYHRFLLLAKYGSLVCGGLLVAMAFGFFTTAASSRATVLFILILRGRRTSCSARRRPVASCRPRPPPMAAATGRSGR